MSMPYETESADNWKQRILTDFPSFPAGKLKNLNEKCYLTGHFQGQYLKGYSKYKYTRVSQTKTWTFMSDGQCV